MQRVRKQIEVPGGGSLDNLGVGEEYTGKGVTVAVLDTGIGRHPDLEGKLLGFHDFVNDRHFMYDDSGHGTHVCGIICGRGTVSGGRIRGVAPDAELVVGKVLDEKGDGSVEHMLEGLQWILDVKERYRIRILNISVGVGQLEDNEKERILKEKLESVWDSGVIVICAAGNKGPRNGSISFLGESRKLITVGCHDGAFYRNNPERCESYSGRGRALAPLRKPDIVAPGTNIISCNVLYGKREGPGMEGNGRNAYVAKSGTSMATPIISGAAALALEKFPGMTGEEFRQRLTFSATDLGENWNKQGWGMVNVRRMLT